MPPLPELLQTLGTTLCYVGLIGMGWAHRHRTPSPGGTGLTSNAAR